MIVVLYLRPSKDNGPIMKRIPVAEQHNVFWGSHGCAKRKNHLGICRCTCKSTPMEGGLVYGDDTCPDPKCMKMPHAESELHEDGLSRWATVPK